jgi:hypothetical protein
MDGWALDSSNQSGIPNITKSGDVYVEVGDKLKSNRRYVIKDPEDVFFDENGELIPYDQSEYLQYVQSYLKNAISAAQGTDYSEVERLIDVESFAEAYIIYELFKNPDTNYSSLYFYWENDGKLVCGPVWDFDMTIGNVNHKGNGVFESTKTLWSKENCPWFNALLNHEEFVALVGEKLLYYKGVILETLERKYEYIYAHADAYKKNFEKWDVIGKNTWTNPPYIVKIKTWEEHVEYTKQYLNASLSYLVEYYCQ